MGRTAQPAALKLLSGRGNGTDSGGRKVNEGPSYVRVAPTPPTWLDREAKAEWKRVVPELERLRLLSRVTRSSLVAYCETWSLFVAATRAVHEDGLTVENHATRKDGTESTWITANPAVTIQRNASSELRRWATEYGLTPASEQKVKPSDPEAGDTDFD